MIKPSKGKVAVKVSHDSDDVGGKVDGDVLKHGVQEGHPLWCDRVGDEDGGVQEISLAFVKFLDMVESRGYGSLYKHRLNNNGFNLMHQSQKISKKFKRGFLDFGQQPPNPNRLGLRARSVEMKLPTNHNQFQYHPIVYLCYESPPKIVTSRFLERFFLIFNHGGILFVDAQKEG
jgi:hypothetical protein